MGKERESRMFWVINGERIHHIEGFDCLPDHPTSWWFPDIGYTCSEGHHVFDTEEEAKARLMEELLAKREVLDNSISILNETVDVDGGGD